MRAITRKIRVLETLDTLIVSKCIRVCIRLTIHRVRIHRLYICAKYVRILGWH